MEADEALAAFQRALLALLWEGLPPEEMQRRLESDDAFAPYRDYVRSMEPRALDVASELVRKWGVRADDQKPHP